MGLTPVTIEQFPGLDLRPDPGDSRGAIDLSNVTLENGYLRTRDGATLLFTPANLTSFADYFPGTVNTGFLIVASTGSPGTVTVLDPAGTTVSTTTLTITADGLSGVGIGTSAASFYYLADGSTIKRLNTSGTAWTSPAGMPANPKVLSVSPVDNRMVVCASTPDCKVWFSDPGAPETFGANNFLLLRPGDNETIHGATVYNNQLYIFKRSKFFVFYGTSVDSTGAPIFNYRTVENGIGLACTLPNPQAVCTGPDGVYFVSDDGIYRTTGSAPVKISAPLDPFFYGTVPAFWGLGSYASGQSHRITWVNNKLYVALGTSTTTGIMFEYDPVNHTWSAWNSRAFALSKLEASTTNFALRLIRCADLSGNKVLRSDPTLSADNGAAIVSRYRLPFESYGSPNKKRLRETILEGIGTVTAQWSKDWGALTPGSAVVLGTAPAIADARQRLAMTGKTFSLQLGAASGYWQVNRAQVNVSDVLRKPEVAG